LVGVWEMKECIVVINWFSRAIYLVASYPNGELHHCGMNKISYA
jgi:hypothetical protein